MILLPGRKIWFLWGENILDIIMVCCSPKGGSTKADIQYVYDTKITPEEEGKEQKRRVARVKKKNLKGLLRRAKFKK